MYEQNAHKKICFVLLKHKTETEAETFPVIHSLSTQTQLINLASDGTNTHILRVKHQCSPYIETHILFFEHPKAKKNNNKKRQLF